MKKAIWVTILLLFAVMLQGCNPRTDSTPQKARFEVYKVLREQAHSKSNNDSLADQKISFYETGSIGILSDLKLDEKPLFTDLDIKTYDWSKHEITFNEAFLKVKNITDENASLLEGGSQLAGGKPYEVAIVVFDGKPLYAVGFAMPVTSSFLPPIIAIQDKGEGRIRFCRWIEDGDDKRMDSRIHDFFKSEKKLIE